MTALCLQWIHMNTRIPPRFDLISFHSFHLKFPMSFLRTAWDHIHGQGAQANAALNLNMRLMTTARVTRSWLLWTCQTLQGHRDCWVHHCHQPTQEIPLSSQVVIILSIRFPQLVFQQEKSYNMRSVWSQPCLQNTHLWYSNSGTLTTLGGVGRIRSMGTSWTKPTNGQSCWYSTNVQKFLARQCWKQCWLNSMAALWLNWRKSFVMYAIYIYVMHFLSFACVFSSLLSFPLISPSLSSGRPGCKNIRAGGDSVMVPSQLQSSDQHRCSTYIVYRSFKYPPAPETTRVRSCAKWLNLGL